jgi:3-dehydroquinate dehydratase type I
MICVSLGLSTVAECLAALARVEFAEIRLDLMEVEVSDIPSLFSPGKRLIAACRPGAKSLDSRRALLLESIRCGAAYVDIEHDAEPGYRISLLREAARARTRVILSYHNYNGTPPVSTLKGLIRKCFRQGAEYVKVACRADSPSDAARLLGLLGDPLANGRLITVGLGKSGRAVRAFAPFLGSPFTYASLEPGRETAPGQVSAKRLARVQRELNKILQE